MIPIDIEDLTDAFGFGVAGNFAGHLQQAGEASDFTNVVADANMPKGIFPWYVPGADTFLGDFPLDATTLAIPVDEQPRRIQVEPEVGMLVDIERDAGGEVRALVPRWAAAFDDCSQRRAGAKKISEKKNWGTGSKGIAPVAFGLEPGDWAAQLGTMRLACFLARDGETHAYGVDSAVATYSLFGDALLSWLVERLTNQRAASDTPLEDVGELLAASGCSRALVGIGASRYEPYGETTFVEVGDEAIVVVYDSTDHSPDEVADRIAAQRDAELASASVLRRAAVPADT